MERPLSTAPDRSMKSTPEGEGRQERGVRMGKGPGSSEEQPYLCLGSKTGPQIGITRNHGSRDPHLTLSLCHSDPYAQSASVVCVRHSSANARPPLQGTRAPLEVAIKDGDMCSHALNKQTGDPTVAGSGRERGPAEDGLFWGDFQLTFPDTSSEEEATKFRRVPAPGAASGSSILSSDVC